MTGVDSPEQAIGAERFPDMTGTPHPQVWAKVNAPVDAGVAPLVSALSRIDGLETIESCQGDSSGAPAFVIFSYGSWEKCGALLFGEILPTLRPDLEEYVSLSLESYGSDSVIGRIEVRASLLESLSERVSRHMSACSGDTPRTLPDSC